MPVASWRAPFLLMLASDVCPPCRVLIFLEALALGRELPTFGLHLCTQLLAAAQHLGLRALEVRWLWQGCRWAGGSHLESQPASQPAPARHGVTHLSPVCPPAACLPRLSLLQEYCQERLGESAARLRYYGFEEVKQLNAGGGCWLILDGMVLDVTRWLPEHPGGSKIIPRQSLNMDCRWVLRAWNAGGGGACRCSCWWGGGARLVSSPAPDPRPAPPPLHPALPPTPALRPRPCTRSRFFELYHASRESFIYLQQLYHGEVLPEERGLVPAPAEPPSAEFLQQLREFTSWRLQPERAATHLGERRGAKGGQHT